jgi:dTDP-4-amino-4,6-dideoxygalactose transaminase
MDRINEIAKKHGIYVIEDASHAHGAEYKGKKTGSLGHAAAFSFQNSKNISAGEGGIIVTDDEAIYARCCRYHNSGRALDGASELGTKARMGEFQAAVLLPQIDRYEPHLKKRIENAAYLKEKMSGLKEIEVQFVKAPGIKHACHLFLLTLNEANAGNRDKWVAALNAEGLPVSRGYINLAKEDFLSSGNDYFRRLTGSDIDYAALNLPNVEKAVKASMWLHGSVLLSEKEDLGKIAEAFEKVSAAYAK